MILISNHMSYLDPVLMGLFSRRKLFFMAKKELFNVPILRRIIKKLGAFPVDREKKGVEALEIACDIVKKGEVVAIFPQGHRSRNIEKDIVKTGFFRIAVMTSCSVVPCSLYYKGYWPRSRVYVYYEEPVEILNFLEESGLKRENLNYRDIKILASKFWDKVKILYKEQDKKYKKRLKKK